MHKNSGFRRLGARRIAIDFTDGCLFVSKSVLRDSDKLENVSTNLLAAGEGGSAENEES